MDQSNLISPYPGLRPFSEAESLYFKGREGHIASIQQELMLKRFLMVTGASGDGKSSLVYAGLLPNVRAGFLRGEFGKWAVAILRPGHIPMQNLSDAVSGAIKEKSSEEIKEQLKYGYSALANLYKQSNLFINKEDSSFRELDEKEQKKALRKGSNLLIVVDQFEEFFTSDNNFNKETALPGVEAMLVMNLLIETARLAKEQNLPIYIICTMRSDYIGNAPAYRGLPELIGNNQFFVPRLIREELVQVIEEPANLNGNAISKRLVQRLINDLDVVNTDVLPSLQHGLRQIWEHAEKGIKEMDLFQYAQVGGMNSDELPENDKKEFVTWFDTLPAYHQQLIVNSKPGISNILNLHANLLYETAHEQAGISITKERSQQILKNTFQCLTQIDDSRAVRHRMTIDQIKEIAKTNNQTLNALLKIFRLQGNTLVYPFLLSEQDKVELPGNTLLDITHEALIRNWKLLLQWTQEEYEDVVDYRELDTAVQRWKQGGRKKEYLFSEGTYEHFVTNHGDSLPSPEWTKRYVEHSLYVTDGRAEKKLVENELNDIELSIKAEENCAEIKDFFEASKHEIEATKKKRKRMLISLALLCIIVSVGFFWATSMWRKSDKLQKEIATTAKANSIATKAYTMLEHDPTLSFRLAEESYKIEPTPLNKQVVMASYSQMPFYQKLTGHLGEIRYAEFSPDGKYCVTASTDNFAFIWNSDGSIKAKLEHNGQLNYQNRPCVFSKAGDKILTCSADSTAKLWNIEGKCLATFKHKNGISSAVFSEDNTHVLTASMDKSAILWDLNGKEVATVIHNESVRRALFIPNSNYFATLTKKTIFIWDYKGKKINELKGGGGLYQFAVSKNGKRVYAIDNTGNLNSWDLSGKLIFKKKGHDDAIISIDISFNDSLIVTGSLDKKVMIWNNSGEVLNLLTSHTAFIWSTNFSPDGKMIVSASNDGSSILWTNNGIMLMTLKGHLGQVISATFSADSKKIITASEDQTARIWEINVKETASFIGHTGFLFDASYSQDSKTVVTSSFDFSVRFWDKSGRLKTKVVMPQFSAITQIFTSSNNHIYINNCNFNNISIYNNNGKLLDTININESIIQNGLSVSKDGKIICTTENHNTFIYNNKNNKKLTISNSLFSEFVSMDRYFYCSNLDSSITVYNSKMLETPLKRMDPFMNFKLTGKEFNSASFTNQGNYLITSGSDSTIRILDFENIISGPPSPDSKKTLIKKDENSLIKIKINCKITMVIPSRKDLIFATVSSDNIIRIWNIDGKLIGTGVGHAGPINDLRFSPDGQFLVSASSDKTVRLWDLNGNELMVYTSHSAVVNKAKFSNDGKYILSSSYDQTARLMPVSIEMVLDKINKEKVRGDVYQLSEADKKVFGIN